MNIPSSPTLADPTSYSAPSDSELLRSALEGDTRALHQLLLRFQDLVYPLALRMLWGAADARDATQEILLKITTHLASFEERSNPRTWVYRIATNHLLNCRRSRTETGIVSFDAFGRCLAQMPDAEPLPDQVAVIEEARIGCLIGMLACLDRTQRIVFLLGEILDFTDVEASAVLSMSADQFRQTLSRTRKQLYEFLGGNCGLANPKNPCRCAKKTRAFVAAGIVDPKRLQFVPEHLDRVETQAVACHQAVKQFLDQGYANLYRTLPTAKAPNVVESLEQLLAIQSQPCS